MSLTKKYLEDLLAEIMLIYEFTADGREIFLSDERTQYAVMMAYARIGEIAKRIPDELII
ncbi:MAG: HepT-like ribonuclease domain-containing protein [Phototrophicaceae bacterium]